MNEILFTIGGLLTSVIAYFLARTMKEHDTTKTQLVALQTKIALLENNHGHLTDSMERLNNSIEKLTDKIDYLTKIVKE